MSQRSKAHLGQRGGWPLLKRALFKPPGTCKWSFKSCLHLDHSIEVSRYPTLIRSIHLLYLGHRSAMVATLQNHSGIQVSMTGLNAAKLRYRLSCTTTAPTVPWTRCPLAINPMIVVTPGQDALNACNYVTARTVHACQRCAPPQTNEKACLGHNAMMAVSLRNHYGNSLSAWSRAFSTYTAPEAPPKIVLQLSARTLALQKGVSLRGLQQILAVFLSLMFCRYRWPNSLPTLPQGQGARGWHVVCDQFSMGTYPVSRQSGWLQWGRGGRQVLVDSISVPRPQGHTSDCHCLWYPRSLCGQTY